MGLYFLNYICFPTLCFSLNSLDKQKVAPSKSHLPASTSRNQSSTVRSPSASYVTFSSRSGMSLNPQIPLLPGWYCHATKCLFAVLSLLCPSECCVKHGVMCERCSTKCWRSQCSIIVFCLWLNGIINFSFRSFLSVNTYMAGGVIPVSHVVYWVSKPPLCTRKRCSLLLVVEL